MNKKAPENPFTEDDVFSALKAYDEEHKSFTRDEISKLSAIEIKANKRNGRKQQIHLEIARSTQAILNKVNGTSWRNENGRPSKEIEVFKYLSKHPCASKAEVIRETGLSKKTVYKYYDKQIFIAQNKWADEHHLSDVVKEFD